MTKVKLLERIRINSILSGIYDHPLTIIEAPMGFGKTTAVRDFLRLEKNHTLWVALPSQGSSVSFFWEKFVAEISKLDQIIASRLKSLGFPADASQMDKVMSNLDQIDYMQKTVLVIDDFHWSTDIRINNFILHIAKELLGSLHTVIITRSTTNIPFEELFSKGKCLVISQQQLKFTASEVHSYCALMSSNISELDIRKITQYTDGWISFIFILLLGLEHGVPVGVCNSIEELVENALFRVYDQHIQQFLLKLSIMNDFTVKQAQFVTREKEAARILFNLRKENAFVVYDQTSKKYTIHNVLLDFLRTRQNFEEDEENGLYQRLGKWHLNEGEFVTAYGYLFQAKDFTLILSNLNNPLNIRNELTEFEGSSEMFESMPQELLDRYPLAYLQYILLSILQGSSATILKCSEKLDRLQAIYEASSAFDQSYRDRIIAEIMIIRGFTYFNRISKSAAHYQEILRLLNGQQSYILQQDNEFTFGSPHLLYIYFRDQGTFKHLVSQITDNFSSYISYSNGCGTGYEYLILAEYSLETGDWKSAELNCFKAIYKAQTKMQTSIIICANFSLMRLLVLQGKVSEAIDRLKQLEDEILKINNPIHNTTIEMCRGYIYACIGQSEKIPHWLQTGDMNGGKFFHYGLAFNYIIYGKAEMLKGNFIGLEMLVESFHEYFSLYSNHLGFIHNCIFDSVAKYHLYGIKPGAAALKKALSKGHPDDIIMPFVENAPYIIDMLKVLLNNDSQNLHLKKVFACSEKYIASLGSNPIKKVTLSQREKEVLTLVSQGLNRQEVAVQLSVSQSTIKTHLQNIYQKLSASGKISAIKTAQLHGLI